MRAKASVSILPRIYVDLYCSSYDCLISFDFSFKSKHRYNPSLSIRDNQMAEGQDRIDPNTVGVQELPRDLHQPFPREHNESLDSQDKNRDSDLCTHESSQLFHDRQVQRQRIDQLVKLFVREPIMSDVETDYILGNVKSRLKYLKNTEFVTINDSLLGTTPPKGFPLERLLKWEEDKKIFAVWVDQNKFFPAFQFAKTKPKPIIERVIQLLPDYMHGWLIGYWFSGGNGWLNGVAPKELLQQEEKVLHAAKQVSLDRYR